jgi:hypothetical protein
MSNARRGRDNRAIPSVDLSSEALEVERRRYHERIGRDRLSPAQRTRESSPGDISPRIDLDRFATKEQIAELGSKPGWRVTKRREER